MKVYVLVEHAPRARMPWGVMEISISSSGAMKFKIVDGWYLHKENAEGVRRTFEKGEMPGHLRSRTERIDPT